MWGCQNNINSSFFVLENNRIFPKNEDLYKLYIKELRDSGIPLNN